MLFYVQLTYCRRISAEFMFLESFFLERERSLKLESLPPIYRSKIKVYTSQGGKDRLRRRGRKRIYREEKHNTEGK